VRNSSLGIAFERICDKVLGKPASGLTNPLEDSPLAERLEPLLHH
jgi:hypothetical protein